MDESKPYLCPSCGSHWVKVLDPEKDGVPLVCLICSRGWLGKEAGEPETRSATEDQDGPA